MKSYDLWHARSYILTLVVFDWRMPQITHFILPDCGRAFFCKKATTIRCSKTCTRWWFFSQIFCALGHLSQLLIFWEPFLAQRLFCQNGLLLLPFSTYKRLFSHTTSTLTIQRLSAPLHKAKGNLLEKRQLRVIIPNGYWGSGQNNAYWYMSIKDIPVNITLE